MNTIHSFPKPISTTPKQMKRQSTLISNDNIPFSDKPLPRTTVGWTPQASVDLRTGAAYLKRNWLTTSGQTPRQVCTQVNNIIARESESAYVTPNDAGVVVVHGAWQLDRNDNITDVAVTKPYATFMCDQSGNPYNVKFQTKRP